MATVRLDGLSKSFGSMRAVRDVSLDIPDREFVVFVGPSGCGKSTLLRMIAGIEEITDGTLEIGGQPMNTVPAADRGVAMVFQSYALYPHMNVRENIGFGLKMAGVGRDAVARKVAEAAASLQIEPLLDSPPRELSGGQRQRVAIGRAIVKSPDVFLFDEPLSNLDADLRGQMRVEIARLHQELAATVIYVTHDQVEAMTLADRIVVLREGVIEQAGTSTELYERPANTFVASFLGHPKMNFLTARVARWEGAGHLEFGSGLRVPLRRDGHIPGDGTDLTVGLRPEAIELADSDAELRAAATVELVENLGREVLVHARLSDTPNLITFTQARKAAPEQGARIAFTFDPAEMHLFDRDGARI